MTAASQGPLARCSACCRGRSSVHSDTQDDPYYCPRDILCAKEVSRGICIILLFLHHSLLERSKRKGQALHVLLLSGSTLPLLLYPSFQLYSHPLNCRPSCIFSLFFLHIQIPTYYFYGYLFIFCYDLITIYTDAYFLSTYCNPRSL